MNADEQEKPQLREGESVYEAYLRGAVADEEFLMIVDKHRKLEKKGQADNLARQRAFHEQVWLARAITRTENTHRRLKSILLRLVNASDNVTAGGRWRFLVALPVMMVTSLLALLLLAGGLVTVGYYVSLAKLHEPVFGTWRWFQTHKHWINHVIMCIVTCVVVHAIFIMLGLEAVLENLL